MSKALSIPATPGTPRWPDLVPAQPPRGQEVTKGLEGREPEIFGEQLVELPHQPFEIMSSKAFPFQRATSFSKYFR